MVVVKGLGNGLHLDPQLSGHIVWGSEVLDIVLERIDVWIVSMITIVGAQIIGRLSILIGYGVVKQRTVAARQRILWLVAVVIVPGVPCLIHLIANIKHVAVKTFDERITLHVNAVVAEGKGLGSMFCRHIVEVIRFQFKTTDERPVGQVGQIEVRIIGTLHDVCVIAEAYVIVQIAGILVLRIRISGRILVLWLGGWSYTHEGFLVR